jgi:hypothetical protein
MGFLGLAYGSVIRGDARKAADSIQLSMQLSMLPADDDGGSSDEEFRQAHFNNQVKTWLGLVTPPLVMFISGVLGALVIGQRLENNTLLFLATLSFGSTSLVYLVTEELLTEAKKNYDYDFGGNVNQSKGIVVFIFVGLYISFVLSTVF